MLLSVIMVHSSLSLNCIYFMLQGPPCELQVSVYEKKFMSDIFLGGADVKLDALASGGQLEEWVPLRAGSDGITW
jgi:hypothetical protein